MACKTVLPFVTALAFVSQMSCTPMTPTLNGEDLDLDSVLLRNH